MEGFAEGSKHHPAQLHTSLRSCLLGASLAREWMSCCINISQSESSEREGKLWPVMPYEGAYASAGIGWVDQESD